ncbi:MAG: hypothetical protein ACLGIN_16105 [Candidatus Sericytochromatia bacterium]
MIGIWGRRIAEVVQHDKPAVREAVQPYRASGAGASLAGRVFQPRPSSIAGTVLLPAHPQALTRLRRRALAS